MTLYPTVDCLAGVIMGWACWQVWESFALVVESWVERGHWTGKALGEDLIHPFSAHSSTSFSVPLISVVVCLTLVHKHPEPVDGKPLATW